MKALLWGTGSPAVSHSLPKLLSRISTVLGIRVPEEVKEAYIRLNKFYTPTRYPDAWSEGIPEEFYSEAEAREAIRYASMVIEWVEDVWRELLRRGEGSRREH